MLDFYHKNEDTHYCLQELKTAFNLKPLMLKYYIMFQLIFHICMYSD